MKNKGFKNTSVKMLFMILGTFLSLILIYFYIDLYFFYKPIEYGKEYSGIVKSKIVSRSNSLIYLNDEKLIILSSRNEMYSPSSLCFFIKTGDSLVKPAFSDTLYIHRRDKVSFFVVDRWPAGTPPAKD